MGLISRINNFLTNSIPTGAQLNAEFDNILDNLTAELIEDHSINVAEMQETTDPGEVGTESLATSVAGEIERLRFAIGEIKGTPIWYSSANATLNEIANTIGGGLPANRISSGKLASDSSFSAFLVPAGSGNGRTLTLDAGATDFVYVIDGTQYTIEDNVTATSLVLAPNSNNTALVNDPNLGDEPRTKLIGEYGTTLKVDNMGSEISSLVGETAAFSITNGTDTGYFLAKVQSTTELTELQKGSFLDESGNAYDRIVFSDNDTITLMRLTWVFANSSGGLTVSYSTPFVGKTEPTSPSVGDYWFDSANGTWKTFDSTQFVNAPVTLIGLCIQDSVDTVGALSFDIFNNFSDLNTLRIKKESSSQVIANTSNAIVSVYGTALRSNRGRFTWDITQDLETGLTEAASTTYYMYLTRDGQEIISEEPPQDRSEDLFGRYHPSKSWRCLGEFRNDASSDISGVIDYADYDPEAYSIVNTVASNALTVAIRNVNGDPGTITAPVLLPFRNELATVGNKSLFALNQDAAVVVPSTATLGFASGKQHYIWVYALKNDDDDIECAVSSRPFQFETLRTTATISAAADDDQLYSTTSRSNKPLMLVGRLNFNLTTAGTWAAVASAISLDFSLENLVPKDAFLYRSDAGSQQIASGTATTVNFEDVQYDLLGNVSVGSSWAYTVPFSGILSLGSGVTFASNAASYRREIYVRVNGSFIVSLVHFKSTTSASEIGIGIAPPALRVRTGDTVDVQVLHTIGSNTDLTTDQKENWISGRLEGGIG